MIPVFPKFSNLSFEMKKEVEEYGRRFPPYSDFNFTSLWSYDVEEKLQLSYLHDNLVIFFYDYITQLPFYSFLGTKRVEETIGSLLELSIQEGLDPVLRLVPEVNFTDMTSLSKRYKITEDHDNHDYILSVDELSYLRGNKYGPKRSFVNRFQRLYPEIEFRLLKLSDVSIEQQILNVFLQWEKNKKALRVDTEIELSAITRLLRVSEELELLSIGLYDKEKLIAFAINEVIHNEYGVIHFEKADITYVGIFQFLKQLTAQQFRDRSVMYINYEQDLGIPGLRKAKESYHPISHLRKYSISPK